MKVLVDTGAAVALDLTGYAEKAKEGQRLVMQNLGPGDIEWDSVSTLTLGTGVKIASGGDIDFDLVGKIYVTASVDDTDLRVTVVG